MRILVLGGGGMLGHKIFQVLNERHETYGTFRSREGVWVKYPIYRNIDARFTITGVDAMEFDSVINAFSQVEPDVVINCIGIIKQKEEAKDPIICISVNSLFPHRLAELCQLSGTRLIHISTDCVFSGKKGNYSEDDISDAKDLYGRTKYLGEVNRSGCLTIRTSIIGWDFANRSALLEWFLGNRDGTINGYVNAIYTGFPTPTLSRIIGDLISDYPDLSGLYQISSDPINKFELLSRINDRMNLNIKVIPEKTFKCDRSLNSTKFRNETGYETPGWDSMISELILDRIPYEVWRNNNATI
ncbi:MAG: dTDP-4-dehydrorhamnose reductase family protein [Candidatus Heimdallarchaeota archaeon]